MRNRAEMLRLARLKKYYSIGGDGVARLRLNDAVGSPEFRANIRKLADLDLETSSVGSEQNQNTPSLAQ